uniref:RNA-directed RNA polymerase L n=1 Tax=Halophytophthora RNA virus 6 TaxID=2717548 RepID=A0A7D5KXC0_9VIRU|nr:RNA-dependent RNA polymerase [Halophytophthora RNA virus 6]
MSGSRILVIDKKTLKFSVGDAQTPFFKYKDTKLGELVDVVPPDLMLSEDKIIKTRRILDMGGSGDCFFIAANAAESAILSVQFVEPEVPDPAKLYDSLGLKNYTYAEDSHIVQVMSCYSYSLVVVREHEGACVFCQFGENSENTVYMFNDYPRHYMLFDQVKLGGSLYSYQQLEDMKRLPDLEVTSQIVELDPLPEVNQSESTFSDDPDDCYGEDVDLAYLYQYVDTRYTIRKSGFELTPADSKVYYKLRHNVFKTVFLNLLGIDSVEEKPFTSLGVDSNRTPDLLLNVSGSLVLVEFTVVKRFITSISTKQSQNKYAVEVEKAHEVYPQVHQFYPTLSLDEVNSGLPLEIFELSKILGKDVYSDPGLTFNDLQQSINSLEFNISELMPELLLNQDEYLPVVFKANVDKIDLPRPFPETVLKVGIKRQRDQNTFNLLRKNARALERQLKRTTYSAKFVFIVNIKHNRIYADVDSKGLQKNKLLSLIQNNSPDCLRYVQYVGSAMSDEEPFKILGTAGFNIGSNRAQKTTKSTDTEQFESYYRSKLYKCSMRKDMDTLIDHPLEAQAGKVESEYLKLLSEKRKHERALEYNKNWFILPCMTKAEPGLYSKLEIETGLPLTDRLIRQANPQKQEKIVNRSNNMELLDQNLVSVNKAFIKLLQSVGNDRKIGRKIKNLRTVEAVNSALPEGEFDADAVMAEVQNYQAAKKAMVKNVGEDTRKAYRNRISFTASYLKTNWPAEMEHFNGPKGKIKMCVDTPLEEMQNKVDTLLEALWQELPTQTVDDVFSNTEPHGNELKHILSQMKDMGDEVMEPLRHTQIMHDLQFISRLSYTILYYSNIKSNKEDFYFDNLGYKDAIVFVKGGKKILSNKKSRLFKFIVPISSNMSWLYSSPNTKLIHQGGVTYCVSPWQTWTFQMLKRTTELYFNFSNYFSCSYLESNLNLDVYKKFISAKVLNMFSQRRKVEVWYGFFRYLYLNSMATHTNVLELIEDMVDFEYDPYFSYCQKKFARRYVDIYEHAKKGEIFDMVTMSTIDNFDLCAEKFDECVFMTVAPFDRVNEHLRNLRSVLKLHKDVVGEFGTDPIEILRKTSVNVADDDYFEKLSSDDLMFDPKLSFCVGKFAGDFLSRVTTETHLSSEFNKITQQTYTNISTSKGLRSSGKNFWGDKGHDVVFSQQSMLDTVKDFLDDLPKTNSEYRHKLVNADESFRDKIGKLSSLSLEFDIKDKAQWKGSREIYVMSEVTKILQSPIEKFFKLLCAWTPNELIHKKSHVRPKFIHGQVFEFEASGDVNTFATLDCRKWAPKSNLWKYYFFVQGMSDHLPSEFVEYFMTVWSLMFRKRVRIQRAYVEMLKKNPETVDLVEVLTERGDGDFEFIMPYSFMMGIFNYLSSLMHAFSQLYFDAKIARPMGVTFNLLAHSDDSGGVIFSNSLEKNYLLFRQYEMYQKSLNHLMSKKKCALSNNFFEMISIMYANKRLIPMTHKFLANVSFEPKGKGWVDDISTIVSKVVEIFSNGGTMLQCYLTMLTMSEMIRKFYHIPRLKVLSKIPIAYGGVFNLHPIHMILLGADCQEVLLDVTESPGERNFRVNVGQSVFGEYFPGKGSPANYHIPYYKSHKLSGIFTTEEMDRLKLISGVIPNTTLGQVSGHYSRLRDPAYVYSLSGVDMCQIYVMTLFTKTMILSVRGEKSCDLRRLTTKYSVLKTLGLFSGESKKSLSTFHHYIKASEGIKLDLNDMDVVSKKTCKPLIYNTFQAVGLGLDFKTVNEIIAYRKDPDLHFMFPDKYRMETLVSWLKTNLQFEDDFILEDYLMKLSSKDMVRTRSSYCFIPSGISVDTVERFWTYINFYCTRRYFISSQKPQYFTVDQFKLWSSDYDTLKHMYLLVRTALRCPLKTETFELLKNNASCSGCSYKSQTKNMIDEIYRLRMTPSYSFLETELPF